MSNYFIFVLGLACAGVGGEFFVRGTVGIAHWLRVSPGIIGATLAAFATSSPELSVAVSSALAGKPQVALGTALGSNVVNIAFILGLALCVSGIRSSRAGVKRDFPVALLVPVVTGVLFLDGRLSRLDGLLMLGMFVAWLGAVVVEVRRQKSAAGQVLGEPGGWPALLLAAAGMALLMLAGDLIAAGARGIALSFGISEFVVGATLVALGTSVPELATTLIARLRGHDEVGLGTLLGSNIFNGLFIVGIAAVIHPMAVRWQSMAVTLAFGIVAVVFTYPSRNGVIERRRGVLLLVLYAAYLTTLLQRTTA